MTTPNNTSDWEKEWDANFLHIMESLGVTRPTEEFEKWEMLLVLIEQKCRNREAAAEERGYLKTKKETEFMVSDVRSTAIKDCIEAVNNLEIKHWKDCYAPKKVCVETTVHKETIEALQSLQQ